MINTKSESNNYKLVEQGDIKETVLGSSTSVKYTHDITCAEDPTTFDYIVIYMHTPSSDRNVMCIAKYYNGNWYTLSTSTVYRTISLLITTNGTSMHIEVSEWLNSSNNNGVKIDGVVGVNRGGVINS